MARDRSLDMAIDRVAMRATADLEDLLLAVQGRVARTIVQWPTSDDGRLLARVPARLDVTLTEAVRRAGWARVRDGWVRGIVDLVRQAIPTLSVTPRMVSMLEASAEVSREDLWQPIATHLSKTAAALRADVMARRTVGDALETLSRGMAGIPAQVRTLIDAAAGGMLQVAFLTAAEEGPSETQAFLYGGPIDGRCRPWCLSLVARVWSRGQIDRMSNGQLPNVLLSRGGYNCRHWWHPVTETKLVATADSGKVVVPGAAMLIASARQASKHKRPRRV
jgi:hypothetical protein